MSTTTVPAPEEKRSLLARIFAVPSAGPFLVLALFCVIFASINERFLALQNISLILQQTVVVGTLAIGQTLIILTAGIDLAVGAICVLGTIIAGKMAALGYDPVLSMGVAIVLCTLSGTVAGGLISGLKLPPFIVTLGMWQIILASNFLYSANETIRSQDIATQAPLLQFFGNNLKLGSAVFTYGVIAMALLVAVLWYVLNHTAWGRHVYAVGDDPDAAELAGVNVKRMLVSVYTLSGLICALAGWALIGRIGSVSPTAGQFANIESITAVVIGGLSLFGGRGSILGMIFGALIVGVFSLGLRLIGTDPQWTYLLIGVLIISAVAIDQWIRKVAG